MVRGRLFAVVGGLALLVLVSTIKLVGLQVLGRDEWRETARQIQVRQVTQPKPRGRILDRNGVPLAQSVPATSIALDNRRMTKPEVLERLLVKHLDLAPDRVADLVYRPSRFTWIARKVAPDTAEALIEDAKERDIRGLRTLSAWKRVYPQGSLASHVIGFSGIDNKGLEGLELAYDDRLRGRPERRTIVRGADGTVLRERVETPGRAGQDVRLTLDARLQRIAESVVRNGVAEYRARGGFAVVTKPKTGKVLALAQDRSYDPNAFAESDPADRRSMPAQHTFEPGSTFKPFAMWAALEAGVVEPGETVDGGQPVSVAGHPIHNAEHRDYGTVSPTDVIARSINTGIVRIAQRLDETELHAFLERLGFGKPTSLRLPGEASGTLRAPQDWSDLAIGTIPIGQGISVTGLQLARAYGSIANDGRLQPLRLRQGGAPNSSDPQPVPERRVASRASTAQVTDMMEAVVHGEQGTGRYARVEGFRIAGKSGTGEKAVPGKGYVEGKYTSLFAGFFPAETPKYLVLVVLDEVQDERYYGGLTAAPMFRDIALGLIERAQMSPQR